TSKKGEVQSLATSSILTDALAGSGAAEPVLATQPLTGRARPEVTPAVAPTDHAESQGAAVATAPVRAEHEASTAVVDVERADVERADVERADVERADVERADAEPADAEPADAEPADAEPADAK